MKALRPRQRLYENPMRLTLQQIETIRQLTHRIAGDQARIRVFGSRLNDDARGGDLDLMLELPQAVEDPALLAARLAAQISRTMSGRKVDVLLSAPNLRRLPIHDLAYREGVLL
jgi:predicted nucleotidyltransferase